MPETEQEYTAWVAEYEQKEKTSKDAIVRLTKLNHETLCRLIEKMCGEQRGVPHTNDRWVILECAKFGLGRIMREETDRLREENKTK